MPKLYKHILMLYYENKYLNRKLRRNGEGHSIIAMCADLLFGDGAIASTVGRLVRI